MTRYWTLKMPTLRLHYFATHSNGARYAMGEWQYRLNVEFYMVDSKSRPKIDLNHLQMQLCRLIDSKLKGRNAPNLARLACLRAYREISRQYPYLLSVKASVEANPDLGLDQESAIMELNVEDLVIEEENNGAA